MKKVLKYIVLPFFGLVIIFFIGLEVYFNFYFDHEQLRLEALNLLQSKVEGDVSLGDIEITVYDRFTHASITVSDLTVKDNTDTLLIIGEAIADVLLTDALSGNFLIENLRVSQSFFMSHVHEDTTRSEIKIIKSSPGSGGQSNFHITSHGVTIKDSRLRIINDLKGQDTRLTIETADISLDANEELVMISGDVVGSIDTLAGAGTRFFAHRPVKVTNAKVDIHRHRGAITFSSDFFNVSNADFVVKGSITPSDSGNYVDIRLSGNDTGLNTVLSFIPEQLGENLFQVNEDASINLIIEKKGLSNKWLRPRTDIAFSIKEAVLRRTDYPDQLKGINLTGKYTNGSERSARTSSVEIATAKAQLRDSYFVSHFTIINFDDPYLKSSIQADMDIEDLHDFIPISDEIKSIQGKIKIDLNLDGKVSQLQGTDLLEDQYKGTVSFHDLHMVVGEDNHQINELDGLITLNNDLIQLQDLSGRFNDTNFRISGEVNEYAGVILDSESAILDCYLKCWTDQYHIVSTGSGRVNMPDIPDYINAGIDLEIGTLRFNDYVFEDISSGLVYYQDAIEIDRLNALFADGKITTTGKLDIKGGKLSGALNLTADYDKLDLRLFAPDSTASQDGKKLDLKMDLSLKADTLIYRDNRFYLDQLEGHMEGDKYTLSKLQVGNDLFNLSNVGPIEIEPEKKMMKGSMVVDLPVIHIDDYLGTTEKEANKETSLLDWWENSDLLLRIRSDSITYGDNLAQKTRATATVRNGMTNLIFQTNAYEGSLSGDLVSNFQDSVWHGHLQLDATDIHLKTFLSENNNFDQKLLNDQHVDGEIDFQTSMNLSYDMQLEDWLPTSGWADIASLNMDLIDFDPITHALKFIKYEYIDTLDVAASEVMFYFIDQEIVLPPVMLKTSESNFLFFGYHDKDDNLELDLQLSIHDLVFKSRKKKYSDFNNAEMNEMGGLDFRMTLSGTPDSLDSKHIRKRIFERKRNDILRRQEALKSRILALKEKSGS